MRQLPHDEVLKRIELILPWNLSNRIYWSSSFEDTCCKELHELVIVEEFVGERRARNYFLYCSNCFFKMSGSLGKPLVNELSEFLKIDNDWDFGKTEQACIDYTNRRKQAWEDELKRREQEKIRLAIEAGVPREIVLAFNGDYRDWYHTIYTQSPAWRRKADEVKRRDGYKCRHCGKTQMEIILHAHHLTYKHMGQLIPYGTEPLEDLLTLCSVCHEKEENRKKLQRYLEYVELTRIIQERQEKEKWQRQNNSP